MSNNRGSTCKRKYFRYVYLYTDTCTLMRQSRNLASYIPDCRYKNHAGGGGTLVLVPAPQRQGGHRSSEADGHQVWVQIQVHIHGYTLVQGKYLQERKYSRYVYLYTYTDTYTLMRQSRNLALHAWWQVQEPRRWWWNTNTSTCTRTRTQTGTRTRVHFKYRESTYIRQVTGTY